MIDIPEIDELLALTDGMFAIKEEEPEEDGKASKFGVARFSSAFSMGSQLSSLMKSVRISNVVKTAEHTTED